MTKPFQFPTRRKAKAVPDVAAQPRIERPAEEVLTPIQGQMPASREEWRVAMALDKLGLEYQYQANVAGGRSLRGGAVADFIVERPPENIPMLVHGRYWHKSIDEERLYMALLEKTYGHEPIILWDEDLQSVEMAVKTVRRELNI
jgi:hypothetical protein